MAQIRTSMRDGSYLCLHAGFFTCGFHIAFLVTHLPGEVALCGHSAAVSATSIGLIGLFNIAGSLCAGWLGTFCRMKYILAVMYASRAVMIAIYLVSPKDPITFYVFAAALGFTWLATVPPTAGLVAKLFGTRYLATLFGLTLLSHQIGGFFGAWLGGLAMAHNGNYLMDVVHRHPARRVRGRGQSADPRSQGAMRNRRAERAGMKPGRRMLERVVQTEGHPLEQRT